MPAILAPVPFKRQSRDVSLKRISPMEGAAG